MLNHVTEQGRLTKDVELRRTNSGKAVASFTIAVDDDFRRDHTIFLNCVAWGKTGEFISQYFGKGRMIVVDGRLDVRDWTDKNGNKRYATEVIVSNAYFSDSKKSDSDGAIGNYSEANANYAEAPANAGDFAIMEDEDGQLPF